MTNKLCCLLKPVGRCENCGILCCSSCNVLRGRQKGSLPLCPATGVMHHERDDHWITENELEKWIAGRSYVKDYLATKP